MNSNFGCNRVSHSTLVIVYWLGPLLAHTFVTIVPMFFNTIKQTKGKDHQKSNGVKVSNGSAKKNQIKDAKIMENNNNMQEKKVKPRKRYYASHKRGH